MLQHELKLSLSVSCEVVDNFISINWNVVVYIQESKTIESVARHCR